MEKAKIVAVVRAVTLTEADTQSIREKDTEFNSTVTKSAEGSKHHTYEKETKFAAASIFGKLVDAQYWEEKRRELKEKDQVVRAINEKKGVFYEEESWNYLFGDTSEDEIEDEITEPTALSMPEY